LRASEWPNDQFYVRCQALFGINLTPTDSYWKDFVEGTYLKYSDVGYKF
jgi:hypothetical protein